MRPTLTLGNGIKMSKNSAKLMYISANLSANASGGRALSEANLEILKACCEVDIRVFAVGRGHTQYTNITSTSNRYDTALANFKLFSGGLHQSAFDTLIAEIANKQPSMLYLDTSLFGRLALTVKKIFPKIKIITFFHNIELDYKLNCYSGFKRILYAPAVLSDWINERWAVHHSDILVVMHNIDSMRLLQIYGRKADFIHPMCLGSNTMASTITTDNIHQLPDEYILFVGSAVPTNVKALKFLCNHVMPHLNGQLIVVGSNFENYRQALDANNVSIIGSVKDISPFYANAKLVVAPILSGTGMIVKVAEALMHGKCVIGSPPTFAGYEKAVESGVCIIANSASDYIALIKNYQSSPSMGLLAKEIFLQYFSIPAGMSRMESILGMATNQ